MLTELRTKYAINQGRKSNQTGT